jgi:hypothetical protein
MWAGCCVYIDRIPSLIQIWYDVNLKMWFLFLFLFFSFCILYLVILPEMSSAERGDGGRPRAGDRGEDLQDWQHDWAQVRRQ